MESSLISDYADACHHNLRIGNVAFLELCCVEGENFDELAGARSVRVNVNNVAIDFVALRIIGQ